MDSAVHQKVENIHFSCLLPRGRQPNPKYFKYFGFEHPPRGDHSNRDYLNNYGTGPETKVKLFRTLTEWTKLHFQVYLWIRTIFLNFEELFARWQGPDKQHTNYGNFEPCLLLRIPEYLGATLDRRYYAANTPKSLQQSQVYFWWNDQLHTWYKWSLANKQWKSSSVKQAV